MERGPGEDSTWQFLASIRSDNADEAIVGADAQGAFRASPLDVLMGDALPLVVDANVLRNDIGYVCRTGRRTALVTATNARIFRTYCAQHVLDEVEEYAGKWATQMHLEPDEYRATWRETFVPLLRRVGTHDMETMLLTVERQRVERLRVERDVDDVPSALLALTIGAFFVSEDASPHETVHGKKLTAAERRAWLQVLHAGGDSAELQRFASLTAAIPVLGAMGTASVVRRLWSYSPLLVFGAVAGTAFFAMRVPRERYRSVLGALGTAVTALGTQVYRPQFEAMGRFRSALPSFPSWDDLVDDVTRDAALARACLYRLARSRNTPITARDLAPELPELGIGQAAQRIGKVLRRYDCFFQPYRDHWQLGGPALHGT